MRRYVPINFTREEMSYYMKHFRQIDVENKKYDVANPIYKNIFLRVLT